MTKLDAEAEFKLKEAITKQVSKEITDNITRKVKEEALEANRNEINIIEK